MDTFTKRSQVHVDSKLQRPDKVVRASVILDAQIYQAKMTALIGSGTYQVLNKDLTDRLTRKLFK